MEKLLLPAFRRCILQLLYGERKREQDKSYGERGRPVGASSLEIRIELEKRIKRRKIERERDGCSPVIMTHPRALASYFSSGSREGLLPRTHIHTYIVLG